MNNGSVNKKYPFFGFTLIELLVVVSIIGILATLLVANYSATRQRARDAQRKADLRNIQTALRMYYNDNNSYPFSCCNWGGPFQSGNVVYANPVPKDPSPNRRYSYVFDSGTGEYTLQACLENKADDKCKKNASGAVIVCTQAVFGVSDGCIYEVKP